MEEFTMGLRVSGSRHNEHMTIAYLGDVMNTFTISDIKDLGKVQAKIIGDAWLGPEKNVHVWLIELLNSEEAIFNLWKKYNVEQEHTKGLTKPLLHITIKEGAPERKVGDIIDFEFLFAKRVGKHNPYFMIDL